MRQTQTILQLLRERGKKRLPVERVYRLLYNPELYLTAYGRIYRNEGAMTKGTSQETADGMTMGKIKRIIDDLRHERYRWSPARRVYISKKNGSKRPLGVQSWSDKLVQEVIRLRLDAYLEPQFSPHSHGFRPERGCHTALREIYHNWVGSVWFIEGDISKCFDALSHEVLLSVLRESIKDERFIHLIEGLRKRRIPRRVALESDVQRYPAGVDCQPDFSERVPGQAGQVCRTGSHPRVHEGKAKEATSGL